MIAKPASWHVLFNRVAYWRQYGTAGLWLLPLWENAGSILTPLGDVPQTMRLTGPTPPSWVADPLGVALHFPGAGQAEVPVPTIGLYDLMNDDSFTLAVVVRPSIDQDAEIVADWNPALSNASVRISQGLGGYFLVTYYLAPNMAPRGGNTLAGVVVPGLPYVIVIVWDKSDPAHHRMFMYLNGGPLRADHPFVDSGADDIMHVPDQVLRLGSYGGGSYFSGNILLVAMQRRVWTPDEIAAFSAEPFATLLRMPPWAAGTRAPSTAWAEEATPETLWSSAGAGLLMTKEPDGFWSFGAGPADGWFRNTDNGFLQLAEGSSGGLWLSEPNGFLCFGPRQSGTRHLETVWGGEARPATRWQRQRGAPATPWARA